MYAIYHGPHGLKDIAKRVHGMAVGLAEVAKGAGHVVASDAFFDTLTITPKQGADKLIAEVCARERGRGGREGERERERERERGRERGREREIWYIFENKHKCVREIEEEERGDKRGLENQVC